MAEKESFLITAQYRVTRGGVVILNEKKPRDPRFFYLNKYFHFLPGTGFEATKKAVLRSLRSTVAGQHGAGCKITLTSRIKKVRKNRGTKRINKGQMHLFQ